MIGRTVFVVVFLAGLAPAAAQHHGAAPRSVTIGVSSLEHAQNFFAGTLDLDIEAQGEVPDDVLAAWGMPDRAAGYVLLSRDGYRAGRIRLIQTDSPASEHVRTDLLPGRGDTPFAVGPKALDIYVPADMDSAVTALEEAGYSLRNGPVDYEFSGLIEAMHAGPDGVPIVLMTRPNGPASDIRGDLRPGTYGEVATLSVITASPPLTARFYGDLLGMPMTLDREASPRLARAVSQLTGVPEDTRVYWQMLVEADQPSGKVIVVHYPDVQQSRLTGRMHPQRLGIALYSFVRPDLDAVAEQANDLGFAVERPPVDTSWGRMMLVRGPNDELVEIVEGESE